MATNLIQTYEGALNILAMAQAYDINWKVRLFVNALTVSDTTVLSDYTEAAWSGYSPATPTWSAAAGGTGLAYTTCTTFTFTYTGASSVQNYGVYITDSGGTRHLGGVNFPSPGYITLTPAAPSYSAQITYTQQSVY